MKNTRTFILFIISIILIIVTFGLVPILQTIDPYIREIILGIMITIGLGFGIVGLIVGLIDLRKLKNVKYWIGLVGNFLILLSFFVLIIYIIFNRPEH